MCYQKPVVAIPFSGDQPQNAVEAKRIGVGEYILFEDLNEENLFNAVDNVLHNPKYTKAAKALGSVMNDQINRPLERAVWWIEHVMRHPTMYEGLSPVHQLSWYQYFLLDVILLCLCIVYILFKVIKLIFYLICFRNNPKSKKD